MDYSRVSESAFALLLQNFDQDPQRRIESGPNVHFDDVAKVATLQGRRARSR